MLGIVKRIYDIWEGIENLKNAKEVVEEFLKRNTGKI